MIVSRRHAGQIVDCFRSWILAGLPRLSRGHEAEALSERRFCALYIDESCFTEPLSVLVLRIGLAGIKGVYKI